MRKKLLLWLLLPVFLLATAGVTVSAVFCKGELYKKGIGAEACCKKDDCCKKESQFLKVKDDFQKSFTEFKFNTSDLLTTGFDFIYSHTNQSNKEFQGLSNAPPLIKTCRNILFCTFLI